MHVSEAVFASVKPTPAGAYVAMLIDVPAFCATGVTSGAVVFVHPHTINCPADGPPKLTVYCPAADREAVGLPPQRVQATSVAPPAPIDTIKDGPVAPKETPLTEYAPAVA